MPRMLLKAHGRMDWNQKRVYPLIPVCISLLIFFCIHFCPVESVLYVGHYNLV
jgi:hypothetical protein